MHYEITDSGKPFEELWQEKTVHVLSGGFNIGGQAQFASLGYLPKGIPLNINFATRTATPIKGAVLLLAVGAGDTTARVDKKHTFVVGDFIGTSAGAAQITAIDASNTAYDVITFSAAIGAVSNGGTLLSATAAAASSVLKATGLCYAEVKFKPGTNHCSVLIQAYEVMNNKLPYPLTVTQQSELTSRFFVI